MARRLMQIGLTTCTVLLVVGLAASSFSRHVFWAHVIVWALAGLVGIPVIPMIGAFADFVRRKEWDFVGLRRRAPGCLPSLSPLL
jgi:hypothetical protein